MRVKLSRPFEAIITHASAAIEPENRRIGGSSRQQVLENAKALVGDDETLTKIIHRADNVALWTTENGWTENGMRHLSS